MSFLETDRPEFPMKITRTFYKRTKLSLRNALKILNCFCTYFVGLLQKRDSPPKSGPISIGKPSVAREMSQTLTTYSLCPIHNKSSRNVCFSFVRVRICLDIDPFLFKFIDYMYINYLINITIN